MYRRNRDLDPVTSIIRVGGRVLTAPRRRLGTWVLGGKLAALGHLGTWVLGGNLAALGLLGTWAPLAAIRRPTIDLDPTLTLGFFGGVLAVYLAAHYQPWLDLGL